MKLIYVLSMLWMVACSSSARDSEKLNSQSINLHNSIVKKAVEMERHLNELLKDKTSVINKDSIIILLVALEEWENDLVEIPGNEEHDHSDHHHYHTVLEVTSEQMLLIQKEMDRRLALIGQRINAFTQK